MPYNKAPHTELQGKSPKMMMYIMVFSVPAITIIATDIAIYFKVKNENKHNINNLFVPDEEDAARG